MSAGADCGTIISGEKESKTFDEFILEQFVNQQKIFFV
jgi:hypothetical protein